MKKIIILLISVTFLTSCDCYRIVIGTVIDKDTRQPTSAAQVTEVGSKNVTITDSLGNFQLRVINSGLQCACNPKNKISISSPLYLIATFKLNKSPFKLQSNTMNITK